MQQSRTSGATCTQDLCQEILPTPRHKARLLCLADHGIKKVDLFGATVEYSPQSLVLLQGVSKTSDSLKKASK